MSVASVHVVNEIVGDPSMELNPSMEKLTWSLRNHHVTLGYQNDPGPVFSLTFLDRNSRLLVNRLKPQLDARKLIARYICLSCT